MPNWLASELCMVASFSLGAWKTFKVLKHGGTDYNLLKTWCLLGLLRAFEEYFEFLVSWIPFYWLGKCLGLGLLYLPGGNIPTVVFERVVVWGMDNAHHVLNNLVVPNVVEFAVSLPWRVLLVLFPTMPAPSSRSGSGSSSSSSSSAAMKTKKAGRGAGLRKKQAATAGGLTSQLQHLNTPTKKRAESTPKADRGAAVTGAPSIQQQTPPLPVRSSPSKTTPVVARNGAGASALVADLLDADDGVGAASRADGAAVATPVPVDDDSATSPESGGKRSGGGGGRCRPSRRRSFGEIIRSAVTGDSEVRLRDHLFDFSTASPAPPLPGGGGGGTATKPATRAARKGPVVPNKASSPASSTALPAVVNGNGKRRGKEKVVADAAVPARPRHTTRRRPSEFSDPVAGGGGGGDEAGGGGSSDGSSRVGGREGVRRRSGGAGAGVGAGAGATGRGTLREKKNGSSSSSSSSSFSAPGGSGSSSATRSARTAADRRGGAATAGVTRGGARSTSTRAGVDTTASSSAAAAAIADSRAKRLEEWRKRRADRAREEQAEKNRRSNHNFDGGGGEGYATTRGVGDGSAGGGDEEESVRGAGGGGARTRANASALAPSRRFRHVERFRSEMARNGLGPPQNPPEDDAAAAAADGVSQKQRRVLLASNRTSRG
ncbi:unnamed protein product [Ectocarpus fasciculatus]